MTATATAAAAFATFELGREAILEAGHVGRIASVSVIRRGAMGNPHGFFERTGRLVGYYISHGGAAGDIEELEPGDLSPCSDAFGETTIFFEGGFTLRVGPRDRASVTVYQF